MLDYPEFAAGGVKEQTDIVGFFTLKTLFFQIFLYTKNKIGERVHN